jgi:NitT/TauT family transport system permease protein
MSLPLLMIFRSMPVAAVARIMMIILGRGIATSLAVVTIVSFFPLLVNLLRGLENADRNALELLHVCGASRWQTLRMVRLPFALPYLLRVCVLLARARFWGQCFPNGSRDRKVSAT